MTRTRFAILGAGHGGLAMAAHLAILGFRDVRLWSRSPSRLAPVLRAGGVRVEGAVSGFGRIDVVTTDPRRAVKGMDVIMVVVPASGHREVAEAIGPHLRPGQIVVLNPGRTGGAIEVRHVFNRLGVPQSVTVAEAQTFLYASRVVGPAQAHIFEIKRSVKLAALPAGRTPRVLEAVRQAFPQFAPASSVWETSLDNMGAIFHPAVTLMNAAWIEAGGDFEYYQQGISPGVARVLEAIDAERCAIARALGVPCRTARDWLAEAYGAIAGESLWDAVQGNGAYRGIRAPSTLDHRYLNEEIPASLIPMAALGELLEVPTPALRGVISLACCAQGTDFWAAGRTLERLGLASLARPALFDGPSAGALLRQYAMEEAMDDAPTRVAVV